MQKINSADELRDAILQLENRQMEEGKMVRDQFYLAYESLKPLNIIKSVLKEASASPDLKGNIVNTSIGLTAGYLSKILFVGVSKNPVKKLFGSVLMFSITNLITRNSDTVKSLGQKFLKLIRGGKDESVNGIP
jgi:hypothetical protein